MLNQIRSDESFQVLAFVVLPLLLLFAGGIIFWVLRTPPSVAQFSDFSMRLSRVGREDAYIDYRDNDRRLEFYVGATERKQALCLTLPDELSDQIIKDLVPKLTKGLAKLGFQKYKIFKKVESQILAAGPQGQMATPD
jgi:hypothetical protein